MVVGELLSRRSASADTLPSASRCLTKIRLSDVWLEVSVFTQQVAYLYSRACARTFFLSSSAICNSVRSQSSVLPSGDGRQFEVFDWYPT